MRKSFPVLAYASACLLALELGHTGRMSLSVGTGPVGMAKNDLESYTERSRRALATASARPMGSSVCMPGYARAYAQVSTHMAL